MAYARRSTIASEETPASSSKMNTELNGIYSDLNTIDAAKLENVVEDTTPQLGGNLDLNSKTVGDATAADLTKLHGITASADELNYVDGVTSAIQTQLNAKLDDIASSTDGNFVAWDGVDGDVVKDSGYGASDFATASHNHDSDYSASDHDHDDDYAPLELTVNEKTDDHILALADAGALVDMNKSSAQTVTIPTNASVEFGVGTQILIRQKSANQVTISGADGVTLNKNADFNAKTDGQYSMAGLIKVASDTWSLFGDLEEA